MHENEIEFERLWNEVYNGVSITLQSYYSFVKILDALQNTSSKSKSGNRDSFIWNVLLHSLQVTYFISLNRVFDKGGSVDSIHTLLRFCIKNIDIFSMRALINRKLKIIPDLRIIIENVLIKYIPSKMDFRILKKFVGSLLNIYDGKYRIIRNCVFGHPVITDKKKILELFEKTNKREFEFIIYDLYDILDALIDLFNNGKKIELGKKIFYYDDEINKEIVFLIKTLE